MRSLDYATLYFGSTIISMCSAIAMIYIWRVHRNDAAVRYWMFGFLCWSGSSLILTFRDLLPPSVSRLPGNLLGTFCITMLYVGTARFLSRRTTLKPLIPLYVMGVCVFIWWGVINDNIVYRVAAYSACVVPTMLLIVRDLWTSGSQLQQATYRFVALPWIVASAATTGRAIALLYGAEVSPAKVELPQALWFVSGYATNILTCVGFLLMVSQRLQEKNNWARMEEIFHETLRLPERQRMTHLRKVCEGDSVMLKELESLIQAAQGPDAGLDHGINLEHGHTARLPTSLGAGARLGSYRIERMIGRGGMGEVYLSRREDDSTGEPVAIKVLRREAREYLHRFLAEYRIAARLSHPGIARVLENHADAEPPFMVFEYIDGEPIIDHCRKWNPPLRQRLQLFRDACEAVSYAHANRIVHRDLKPSNILVTAESQVKLLDFGVAKTLNTLNSMLGDDTVTMAVPVTVEYAAPEQLEGDTVTAATDVYALGILLFELLTDELPWKLRTLPVSVALHKILKEPPLSVSVTAAANRHPPVLPRLLRGDLDAIVAKAMHKHPRDRYDSVAALLADIDGFLGSRPISARPNTPWRRAGMMLRRRLFFSAGN